MPWGIQASTIRPLLRDWIPGATDISVQPYGMRRGAGAWQLRAFSALPVLRDVPPAITHIRTASAGRATGSSRFRHQMGQWVSTPRDYKDHPPRWP